MVSSAMARRLACRRRRLSAEICASRTSPLVSRIAARSRAVVRRGAGGRMIAANLEIDRILRIPRQFAWETTMYFGPSAQARLTAAVSTCQVPHGAGARTRMVSLATARRATAACPFRQAEDDATQASPSGGTSLAVWIRTDTRSAGATIPPASSVTVRMTPTDEFRHLWLAGFRSRRSPLGTRTHAGSRFRETRIAGDATAADSSAMDRPRIIPRPGE